MTTRLGSVAGVLGASFFALNGLWAFVAPGSFFEQVATWPPYNEHLLRDAGSFSLGVSAALILSMVGKRSGVIGLGGGAVAAAAHALSHIIDFGGGGRASDPYTLGALALLLLVAAVSEKRGRR